MNIELISFLSSACGTLVDLFLDFFFGMNPVLLSLLAMSIDALSLFDMILIGGPEDVLVNVDTRLPGLVFLSGRTEGVLVDCSSEMLKPIFFSRLADLSRSFDPAELPLRLPFAVYDFERTCTEFLPLVDLLACSARNSGMLTLLRLKFALPFGANGLTTMKPALLTKIVFLLFNGTG